MKHIVVPSLSSYLWPLITPSANGYITHGAILATKYLQQLHINKQLCLPPNVYNNSQNVSAPLVSQRCNN